MTDITPATDEELRTLIGKALEPFASFAQNIDKDGWVSNIHREPISNWFGPSDFRSALEALNSASCIRAETAKNSGEVVACHCTLIEQDESCPIGYPSLLCDDCDGKGHVVATPANSRAEAIGVDVRNYGARGSIFDADPIRKAAWKVVLETDRIHDNEPWPIKYRAPYEAIAELRALLQQEGE